MHVRFDCPATVLHYTPLQVSSGFGRGLRRTLLTVTQLFFAFGCMVTYSAMHGRVVFVPAPLRYSCETAIKLSSFEPGKWERNIVAMMRFLCAQRVTRCAVADRPCNQSVLTFWACSILITVGIIYLHHAVVNTFFYFF